MAANRGYVVGCCIIVAAAALGYWIFSDRLTTHRPPPPTLMPAPESGTVEEKVEVYLARNTGDVIDLGRAYEPTGEELDLHNLLYGQPVAELAPAPRERGSEVGPAPRELERELLPAPTQIVKDFAEAAEEASSLPVESRLLPQPLAWSVAALCADWLGRSLPLKGTAAPAASDPK